MKTLVVATLALASLAAAPATAATRHRAPDVTAGTAVYFAGRNVGQDPDSFIRLKLLQDGELADD